MTGRKKVLGFDVKIDPTIPPNTVVFRHDGEVVASLADVCIDNKRVDLADFTEQQIRGLAQHLGLEVDEASIAEMRRYVNEPVTAITSMPPP